jgi:hypothetical protein
MVRDIANGAPIGTALATAYAIGRLVPRELTGIVRQSEASAHLNPCDDHMTQVVCAIADVAFAQRRERVTAKHGRGPVKCGLCGETCADLDALTTVHRCPLV